MNQKLTTGKAGRRRKDRKVSLNTRIRATTKDRLFRFIGSDQILCEVVERAIVEHMDRGARQ